MDEGSNSYFSVLFLTHLDFAFLRRQTRVTAHYWNRTLPCGFCRTPLPVNTCGQVAPAHFLFNISLRAFYHPPHLDQPIIESELVLLPKCCPLSYSEARKVFVSCSSLTLPFVDQGRLRRETRGYSVGVQS